MYGVLVNAVAIVVGALLGLIFRNLIAQRLVKAVELGIGLTTLVIGIKMALQYENVLLLIICIAAGGAVGSALEIEKNLELFAARIQKKFTGPRESKFAVAFTSASILYCTGAFAIIGSINAGVRGDFDVIYTKSLLDGIFSITLAAIYGAGVALSALPVFLYQGAIALFASRLDFLSHPQVINEISGVGGVLIVMIGLNITGMLKIRVGDYLPSLVLVMIAAPIMYNA